MDSPILPHMPPSGGGQPYPASRDRTTPFPEASGAQTRHASERPPSGLRAAVDSPILPQGTGPPLRGHMPPSGGGQPYPASRDRTSPFPLGYKAKGKWEALGDGACRRRYGRPERERSYRTSPFPFGFLTLPVKSNVLLKEYTGTRRQERSCVRIETLTGVHRNSTSGEVLCTDRDFNRSTQELDVRRGSVYG